jgi:hypothetical protein
VYGIIGYHGCGHAEARYEQGLPPGMPPPRAVGICGDHENESSCVARIGTMLEKAKAAFQARKFSTAAVLYGSAYQQIPHPILLFNRAEVYRAWATSLCTAPQADTTGNITCKQTKNAALKDYRMFLLLSPHDPVHGTRARQIIEHWRP